MLGCESMKRKDIEYLCNIMSNLCGLPVRIYAKKKEIFFSSLIHFSKDPILPYEDEIFAIQSKIGYYITPEFFFFGIVKYRMYTIVLGPSRPSKLNTQAIKSLAFTCDICSEEINDFINGIESLVAMPLSSIIQVLCSINFVLNGTKLSLKDITIQDTEQSLLLAEIEKLSQNISSNEMMKNEATDVHNTFQLEELILNFVQHGDIDGLKQCFSSAPAVHSGTLAAETLRDVKNTFIVTATLVSRAAIRGGLNVQNALSLSDIYIQRCELLDSLEHINNLQYHMVLDYAERVHNLFMGQNVSRLAKDVANYVQQHLFEPMDIASLSHALFISRTHLAALFKKETGITLSEYVLNAKIIEAKKILCHTDKSISAIAIHLGFSSQSHFTNTFKKITGITPNEYKSRHSQF